MGRARCRSAATCATRGPAVRRPMLPSAEGGLTPSVCVAQGARTGEPGTAQRDESAIFPLSPKIAEIHIESHRRAIRRHNAGGRHPSIQCGLTSGPSGRPGKTAEGPKCSRAEAWIGRHDDTRGASSEYAAASTTNTGKTSTYSTVVIPGTFSSSPQQRAWLPACRLSRLIAGTRIGCFSAPN